MAGSYPDAPGRRMAWDADGTVGLYFELTSAPVAISSLSAANLNDENNASLGPTSNSWWCLIFPELREIDGVFASLNTNSNAALGAFQTSPDTTNGHDGAWTSAVADMPDLVDGYPSEYRDSIQSLAVNARRAVRLQMSGSNAGKRLQTYHVYGTISPGETPDRLLWIDEATGLEFTAPLDVGNIPRGGSADYDLRLRNNSATFTIETIQYTAESLYLNSGNWWTFTLPGGATFQSTRQIASLAPATTTGLIVARRITPAAETLSTHAGRFRVTHTALT